MKVDKNEWIDDVHRDFLFQQQRWDFKLNRQMGSSFQLSQDLHLLL